MKKVLFILLCVVSLSCKHNPVTAPNTTMAQAEMDQVDQLKNINIQLERIATALEKSK